MNKISLFSLSILLMALSGPSFANTHLDCNAVNKLMVGTYSGTVIVSQELAPVTVGITNVSSGTSKDTCQVKGTASWGNAQNIPLYEFSFYNVNTHELYLGAEDDVNNTNLDFAAVFVLDALNIVKGGINNQPITGGTLKKLD